MGSDIAQKNTANTHTQRIQVCPKKLFPPKSYSGAGIETINPLGRGLDSLGQYTIIYLILVHCFNWEENHPPKVPPKKRTRIWHQRSGTGTEDPWSVNIHIYIYTHIYICIYFLFFFSNLFENAAIFIQVPLNNCSNYSFCIFQVDVSPARPENQNVTGISWCTPPGKCWNWKTGKPLFSFEKVTFVITFRGYSSSSKLILKPLSWSWKQPKSRGKKHPPGHFLQARNSQLRSQSYSRMLQFQFQRNICLMNLHVFWPHVLATQTSK